MAPAPTQDFIPRYQWDETLLHQGRYGEWFWSTMTEGARSWLRHAQCQRCGRTPQTTTCGCHKLEYKPAGWVNRDGLLWQLQAACQGADVNIFIESNTALYNQPDAPWREYCGRCPVISACILYAVDSKSEGVFGGQLFGTTRTTRSKNPSGNGLRGRPRKVAG